MSNTPKQNKKLRFAKLLNEMLPGNQTSRKIVSDNEQKEKKKSKEYRHRRFNG
jgi:hypothetical protein